MARLRDALIYALLCLRVSGWCLYQAIRSCMYVFCPLHVMFVWIQASAYSAGVGAYLACISGCNLPKYNSGKNKKSGWHTYEVQYIHAVSIPGTQGFLFCSSAHQNLT